MNTTWALRKENASCCNSRRDKLGRLPIGYCSTSCLRIPLAQRRRRLLRAATVSAR